MKNYFFVAMLVVCSITFFAGPARAQSSATMLEMHAVWDDGTPVHGTVTLGLVHVIGADTVIATSALTQGISAVSEALAGTSIYNITLVSPTGTTLVKFPITTALINPQNLKGAAIHLVLRKADSSLKSARVQVSMGF